jgi:hypothetical protein
MYFDLSRSELENLLTGFLVGALGVELKAQVHDLTQLPEDYRTRVCKAESQGRPWTAWSTDRGLIAVWGEYDLAASRSLHAFVLFLSWYGVAFSQHGMWCYCYPNRPAEWIVGRERVQ